MCFKFLGYFGFIVFILISNLDSKEVKDFYFKSDNYLQINQKNKTIKADGNVIIHNQEMKFNADNLYVEYTDINNINLNTVNNIKAVGNVKIRDLEKNITSDKYVFDKAKAVHVFEALKNPIIYKDKDYKLVAKDRIEYFIFLNQVVVRGQPVVYGKSGTNNYEFHAKIMNAQLKTINKKQYLDYIEGIDDVRFISQDNKIFGNYAIYYKDANQVEFHGNITIKNPQGIAKACGAIINLDTNMSRIISCSSNNNKIKGTYEQKSK